MSNPREPRRAWQGVIVNVLTTSQGDETLGAHRPDAAVVEVAAAASTSDGQDPAGSPVAHAPFRRREWLVVDGLDAAEWTAHTMEALTCAQDWCGAKKRKRQSRRVLGTA